MTGNRRKSNLSLSVTRIIIMVGQIIWVVLLSKHHNNHRKTTMNIAQEYKLVKPMVYV